MSIPDRPVLFTSDLIKLTGRHRNTVRGWWKSGALQKPTKIGRCCSWPREVIVQFLGLTESVAPTT